MLLRCFWRLEHVFFKRKQATSFWVSDCHGRGWEVISPLLICVIVSSTYQENLLSHPRLPCQQESVLCWQFTLKGWKGVFTAGNHACLWGKAVCRPLLGPFWPPQSRIISPTTVKTLQQKGVTVWSGKHFRLQNNECIVQRRINSILAAGWLMMSQKGGKSLGRIRFWDRHTFCINLYK